MDSKTLLARIFGRMFVRTLVPGARPKIVWLVPFVSRANSRDWERACAVLAETLASVKAVEYDNWALVLCSQDRPACFPDGDPRFHFLPAPQLNLAKGISDHRHKIKMMTDYAAQTFREFVYLSHLDADDLLHPDLPGFIARDGNGCGYIVEKGFMADARSGDLAPMGEPGDKPFWKDCGSCAYLAVDFAKERLAPLHLRLIGKGHKTYVERAAALGRPLDPVPFPAMIYVVNHGENIQDRKGNSKLMYLDRRRMTDPALIKAALDAFGLRLLAEPGLAGLLQVRREG
ncbi:hypothetical protein V8J36_10315 [Frigidibacter sp. MR17.14]|uniref:hypothetical protein n=1 Tax=Frigidibacter sp. MR17.14 TaxID=3126509 RepID=UPI003012B345